MEMSTSTWGKPSRRKRKRKVRLGGRNEHQLTEKPSPVQAAYQFYDEPSGAIEG
jgi:hypothetical protein